MNGFYFSRKMENISVVVCGKMWFTDCYALCETNKRPSQQNEGLNVRLFFCFRKAVLDILLNWSEAQRVINVGFFPYILNRCDGFDHFVIISKNIKTKFPGVIMTIIELTGRLRLQPDQIPCVRYFFSSKKKSLCINGI